MIKEQFSASQVLLDEYPMEDGVVSDSTSQVP